MYNVQCRAVLNTVVWYFFVHMHAVCIMQQMAGGLCKQFLLSVFCFFLTETFAIKLIV